MKVEILRDKTTEIFEKFLDSKGFSWFCYGVMSGAVAYFAARSIWAVMTGSIDPARLG